MRGLSFAVIALIWLMPAAAEAAAGSGHRPSEHWSEMQKLEFYMGRIAGALNICRKYALASELEELAGLSPYGRKGLASVQAYDSIKGGYCGKLAADGEALLADRDKFWAYLTDVYDCPGGECAPEVGDGSANAPCRAETDEHLTLLPVDASEIKSIKMVSRNAGATRLTTGKAGHEAWVRLDSCGGWLVMEMTPQCALRQSFTRGDCEIEGIKGF